MNNIKELLTQAKSGDKEAFALLYKEYYVPVYRYIYLRVKSREQAEDLTQDVFLKIYRNIGSIDPEVASPLNYFYTITRNTLIDTWRKKTPDTVSDEDHLNTIPDEAPTALETASLKEQSSLIRECLTELTNDQREVVTLRFIEDLSTHEVAEILGKKETAVRQLQVRGLRTLSKVFKQKYG